MATGKRSCTAGKMKEMLSKLPDDYIIKLNKNKHFSIKAPKENNRYVGYIDLDDEQIVYDGDT